MNKKRLDELAEIVRFHAWALLDGEIDFEPEDAGKVAQAVEDAFRKSVANLDSEELQS